MRHPRAVNQLVVTYLTCGFAVANATNYYYDPGYQILLGIRGKF